jgi:uncharacterized protein (DUF952 family)
MERIVHILIREEWVEAQKKLGEYSPESLLEEGFIHCSRPQQVLKVANRYFTGTSDLALLWIDVHKLRAVLLWELSDGDVFPHLYGPLNLEAIIAVVDFTPDLDGVFRNVPEPE